MTSCSIASSGSEKQRVNLRTFPWLFLCFSHWFTIVWWLFLSGWWLVHPSEKYESIGMMKFPIYGKIKNGNQTTNQNMLTPYEILWYPLNLHRDPVGNQAYGFPIGPQFSSHSPFFSPRAWAVATCAAGPSDRSRRGPHGTDGTKGMGMGDFQGDFECWNGINIDINIQIPFFTYVWNRSFPSSPYYFFNKMLDTIFWIPLPLLNTGFLWYVETKQLQKDSFVIGLYPSLLWMCFMVR